MKKNIFYILATLFAFMIMGLSSCSDEQDIGVPGTDVGERCVVTFKLAGTNDKPSTRATTDGPLVSVGALEREKIISRLDAVVFKSGVYFKTIEATKVGEEGANYELDMEAIGTFDFYLLANADATLLADIAGVTFKAQFENLVAGQTPGEDNNATGFLMTSAEEIKGITTKSGEPNNITEPIKLTRLSARFDFYNVVPGLELTQIVFKNRYHQSKISRALSNSEEMSDLGNADKTYTSTEGLTGAGFIGGIYGYEDLSGDNATFELIATYNGNAIKHTLALQQHSDIKNIRRNNLYTVVISPKGTEIDPSDVFGSLKFDITVKDWEEGEGIIFGGAENLADSSVPNFTVTPAEGTTITTIPAAGENGPVTNPDTVTLISNAAGSITVTVTSNAVGARLEPASGTLPEGYECTPGTVAVENGALKQVFTITLPANDSGKMQSVEFVVANALHSTSSLTFMLNHGVDDPVEPPVTPSDKKLSLEYVAETNMAQTDASAYTFATNNANTNGTSGFYSWSDACTRFGNFKVGSTAYHLPTKNEWLGILPLSGNVYFNKNQSTSDVNEAITVAGNKASYRADYKSTTGGVAYGLRFKKGTGEAETGYTPAADNSRRSAWRYEYVDNTFGGDGKMLKVSATYLGDDITTLDDISSADWWTNRQAGSVVVRYFPASGFNGSGTGATGSPSYLGSNGYYWSATENDTSYAWLMNFNSTFAYTGYNTKSIGFTVRAFSNE